MPRITEKDIRSWSAERYDRERRLRRAWLDWKLPQDREWAIIQGLRQRAASARRVAYAMLVLVIVIGLVGAAGIVAVTFGFLATEAETARREALRTAAEADLTNIEQRNADVDSKLAALINRIRTEATGAFAKVEISTLALLFSADISPDGSAIVSGAEGTLLTRASASADWVHQDWPGRTGSEALAGIDVGPDGSAIVLGNEGTLLTRASASADWVRQEWPGRTGSETLWEVDAGPDGSAIVSGAEGTLLTRASASADWVHQDWPGRTGSEALAGIDVGPDGSAIVLGNEGTLLTRASASADWVRQEWPGRTGSETLWEVDAGPDGSAIVSGAEGTLLTRASASADWVRQEWPGRTGSETLWEVDAGPDGSAIVLGVEGTLLTRASASADWVRQEWPGRTGSEALGGIDVGPDGSAIVLGNEGTLLTRASASADWVRQEWPGRTGSEALGGIDVGPDGSAIVLGNEGTLLTRASASADWVRQEWPGRTGSEALKGVYVGPAGSAIVLGVESTLLTRASASADWVRQEWPGRTGSETLWGVDVGPAGSAIVRGDNGTLLTRVAHDDLEGDATLERLYTVVLSLPNYTGKTEWLNAIRDLENERRDLRIELANATAQVAASGSGALTRQQSAGLMQKFLDACRRWPWPADDTVKPNMPPQVEILEACVDAFRVAVAEDHTNWYKFLVERATPALLLLFLLATMGAGYRYNLRLAALHDSRADAIALWAGTDRQMGVDPESGKQIGDASPDLIALIEAMAADKMGFKEPRTPVDTITDIAKSVIARIGPGEVK